MNITGNTKVLGIFGDPVKHSLSPAMHNKMIDCLKLDMVYVPWRVRAGKLEKALAGVKAMEIQGINLTIPHKEKALRHLDEISDEVKLTGAANTVVNREGRLIGHNTDGKGFFLSLKKKHRYEPLGKELLIIGAGGAARGIAVAAKMGGAEKIIIANRTKAKAADLADELNNKFSTKSFLSVGLDKKSLIDSLRSASLLVNASSAGMGGMNNLDVSLESLPQNAIVADIVYTPLMTKLLSDAKKTGLAVEDGLGMLACQGAIAFELWTGIAPSVDKMIRFLRETVD